MGTQTPKQRAANAKWAKKNIKKQGKPRSKDEETEYPVSRVWLAALLFLVCGGIILELIRMVF
ncbi:Piso0_002980 [Millerozyma farinosa CBS 7064]|uniref:Stress-associated endoplasmic reticulum protein n=1 Tax=Pichia sorbitophila (strain ATCC MYA-4447 / BCRC 22081 / CBS 7064 / NBRC 10061 / NRRL Y-12695) TaxID=559304 RepID=G8YK08_PICSO|nr:Piso0_002980 [Millerozyma farinosa CBS 7064]CCE80653.1 Piso0_002980 [Millerozyma farinosa CBS 7064]